MDLKEIEDLIALMRKSGLTQLSLEMPDYKVSITRGAEPAAEPALRGAVSPAVGSDSAPPADPPAALPLTVISPVVGVFYNGGNSPGRRMLGVGGRVKRGELLATIEAMKVPNEVRSPAHGLVTAVVVEDGSAVEYGQTLFLILPEEGGEGDEGESAIGIA